MPVSQQIKKFIDNQKLGKSELAKILEVTHTTIAGIYDQKRNPRSDILEKLLTAYPTLSAQWLLTGEGPMWKEEMITQYNDGDGGQNVASIHQVHESPLDFQRKAQGVEFLAIQEKVAELETRIEIMTQNLEDKQKLIAMLESEVQRLKGE